MKNPIFMAGLLIAIITIMQFQQKGIFDRYKQGFDTSPCRSVKIRLDKRIPSNWKTECIDGRLMTPTNKKADLDDYRPNDLVVNVYEPLSDKIPADKVEASLYREMSNYLISIAKKSQSPAEYLANVSWVIVRIHHKDIILAARTKGEHIIKLTTLKNKSFIAQHLKNTVVVQTNKAIK